MMRLEMLPAAHGDALVVEWGSRGRTYRMLVDGGPLGTYEAVHERIAALPARSRGFELLIVTHIDGDHIEGVVRLLQDRQSMHVGLDDVWFNGWPQLEALRASDRQGADQGEMVGALLRRDELPWNVEFDGDPVAVPEDGPLREVSLPGGAHLTVLGPGADELSALRRDWVKVLREIDATPGDPDAALARLARRRDLSGIEDVQGGRVALDSSVANGSSVAVLFEQGGHALLLTGDSHGDVLSAGLSRLLAQRGEERLYVDAFKLPHHGSKGNVTTGLLDLVATPRYLFSTSGARFHHPDKVAVERALDRIKADAAADGKAGGDQPELVFNYRSATTTVWESEALQRRRGYRAVYPQDERNGVVVEVAR